MDIRSFLAFDKPDIIRSTLEEVSGDLSRSDLDVRWVKIESIHLTIVFLGSVPAEDLEAMHHPLAETCAEFAPFSISLKGLGCFPHTRNPKVIWVGIEGDTERMARFRDRLQARLVQFGIREEKRPFRPHLTLGRFNRFRKMDRELERYLEKYRDLAGPLCSLGELVLFKSELRRGGSIYTPLKSWPLTGSE